MNPQNVNQKSPIPAPSTVTQPSKSQTLQPSKAQTLQVSKVETLQASNQKHNQAVNRVVVQEQNDPIVTEEALIQKVLEALGSRLDPMLKSVQEHWDRTAAQIDAKLESQSRPSMIQTIKSTVPSLPVDQTIPIEKEQDISMIIDTAEPSMLYNQEDWVLVDGQEGEKGLGVPDDDAAILILNKSPKVAPQVSSKDEGTKLAQVVVLPEYLVQDLIDSKIRRQKWSDAYYGPRFEPAAVISR